MNVYKYIARSNDYARFVASPQAAEERVFDKFGTHRLVDDWKPPVIIKHGGPNIGDFPSLRGSIPVFSNRAWYRLAPLISSAVEALPLRDDNGMIPYLAINVLDSVDCLDYSRSKLIYFSDGSVMKVDSYAFHEDRLRDKHIFRIPETAVMETLVSSTFKELVEKEGLEGLRFRLLSRTDAPVEITAEISFPSQDMDTQRTPTITTDSVIVSDTSVRSANPREIVKSNASFVKRLLQENLTEEEISADSLRSYYVDYYSEEMNNGGFSQFVYNSRWRPRLVQYVLEGLRVMKAERHLELFQEGTELVERIGLLRLRDYFSKDYFGENANRDELNSLSDKRLGPLSEQENLIDLNATWLRQLPNLVVLTVKQMEEFARRRGQAIPDRQRRIAEGRAKEPRYMKLIRALCKRTGQKLIKVTGADLMRVHEGAQTRAWHFITNMGHHHMIDIGGRAIMFREFSTTDPICDLDAGQELSLKLI